MGVCAKAVAVVGMAREEGMGRVGTWGTVGWASWFGYSSSSSSSSSWARKHPARQTQSHRKVKPLPTLLINRRPAEADAFGSAGLVVAAWSLCLVRGGQGEYDDAGLQAGTERESEHVAAPTHPHVASALNHAVKFIKAYSRCRSQSLSLGRHPQVKEATTQARTYTYTAARAYAPFLPF